MRFLSILFIFLTLLVPHLHADTLLMKNGDRLTGIVLQKDGKHLSFKTDYGTFNIAWAKVEEISSDNPMIVLHGDGTTEDLRSVQSIDQKDIEWINPAPWRLGDGYQFSGNANLALQLDRGNTDKDEIEVDGKVTARSLYNRFSLWGEKQEHESAGAKTADNWLARAKYDRFLNKRLFVAALGAIDVDDFASLDRRLRAGPQVGYQFYESKPINLSAELGFMRIKEEFQNTPADYYYGSTWLVNFDYYLIEDTLQLYHNQDGLWNVEHSDKYIWKSWTGLRVPLIYGIVGSGEVNFEYDSQPAAGADKTDTTYSVKLGYAW